MVLALIVDDDIGKPMIFKNFEEVDEWKAKNKSSKIYASSVSIEFEHDQKVIDYAWRRLYELYDYLLEQK